MPEPVVFEVPFAPCRRALDELQRSTKIDVRSAADVDAADLFTLDTILRRSTPGNDDWAGDRTLFDDELDSPEFDPTGYLVALVRGTDEAVGLVRFWRNDPLPKLGLIGVLPHWRDGRIAATLLADGLDAASTWGSTVFRTHTARPALQRRLHRLGAQRCP